MSGSKITIDEDLLDNVHPGEILREEFRITSEISVDEVAQGTGLEAPVLRALLDEALPINASLDLRLARYFGVSEGFFLRLQNRFDLEEERRAHGDELDRIVQRAA